MTVDEAVIIWHQPHNRLTAVSTAKADAELLAALKMELANVTATDAARDTNGMPGCIITRQRRKALTDLLAAVAQE